MSVDILERRQTAAVEPRQQAKILIIEGDEAAALQLERRLRQHGFATVRAVSGETGLAVARSDPPWVVILGLGISDIDGLSACEQLADGPGTCGIPIIVLGSREMPDAVRRTRAAGGHYFLAKPCDPNVLLLLIRQAIADTDHWDDSGDL
jgi:DNA-binding response OmpR family regulator